jgi:hypothetical protein
MKEDLLIAEKKRNVNQFNRRSFLTLSALASGAMLIPKTLRGKNKLEQRTGGQKKLVRNRQYIHRTNLDRSFVG